MRVCVCVCVCVCVSVCGVSASVSMCTPCTFICHSVCSVVTRLHHFSRTRPDDTPWEGGACRCRRFIPLPAHSVLTCDTYRDLQPHVGLYRRLPQRSPEDQVCDVNVSPKQCVPAFLRTVSACLPTPSLAPPLSQVYLDGNICLDILQNNWSPIYDVVAVLSSIQVRTCVPARTWFLPVFLT